MSWCVRMVIQGLCGALVVGLGLAALGGWRALPGVQAAGQAVPAVVRAPGFALTDAAGETRAGLLVGETTVGLVLFDTQGQWRGGVTCENGDGVAKVALFDTHQVKRLEVAASTANGVALGLFDPNRQPRASLGVTAAGSTNFRLTDGLGKNRTALLLQDNGLPAFLLGDFAKPRQTGCLSCDSTSVIWKDIEGVARCVSTSAILSFSKRTHAKPLTFSVDDTMGFLIFNDTKDRAALVLGQDSVDGPMVQLNDSQQRKRTLLHLDGSGVAQLNFVDPQGNMRISLDGYQTGEASCNFGDGKQARRCGFMLQSTDLLGMYCFDASGKPRTLIGMLNAQLPQLMFFGAQGESLRWSAPPGK